jgi:thiol-disulfide isomerase/thioredoxin
MVRSIVIMLLIAALAGCSGQRERHNGQAKGSKDLSRVKVISASAVQLLQTLRHLKAEAVVVNIWATHCPPCVAEFPDLIKLRRNYKDLDVALVLICVDPESNVGPVRQFLADQGVDFPTYIRSDTDRIFIQTFDARWKGRLPATWIFDADGTVRHFWVGRGSYEFLESKVEDVIDKGMANIDSRLDVPHTHL